MFISTLLLIPWIIYGFKNPKKKYIGLNQTKKSIFSLFIVELLFFITLILLLAKPNPNVAGQGSFAWMYMYIYEKGIFPIMIPAEMINGYWGDKIDNNYKILFLVTALVMDYVILKLISPNTIAVIKRIIKK
jgi:hypothetical protein